MFIMAFCASGMLAQSEVEPSQKSEVISGADVGDNEGKDVSPKGDETSKPKSDNYEAVAELIRLFNKQDLVRQLKETDDYKNVFFPVEGKGKFMRHQHNCLQ